MSVNHVHGTNHSAPAREPEAGHGGSSADFANIMGMSGAEILNFIFDMLRQAAGGQQSGSGAFDPSFNPNGMTPNERTIGMEGHCAGGHGAHGGGHGVGGSHAGHGQSSHGSGGAHGAGGGSALRDPVYAERAPDDIVAGLGGLVDAEGNVEAANKGQHSGHAGHEMGHELNVHATYEAASAAGIDADQFIGDFVADDSNFNPNQTTEQKYAGALTVLNDMTAAVTMGGIEGDLGEISTIAGSATEAALAGDADALRGILTDAGGDVRHMSDDMLLNTWATNSHMYNHSILNVESDHFALTHLRSLNDNASDGTEPGTLGFYNDKGAWPQWGAQEDAIGFLNETLGALPSSGAREVRAYSGGGGHGHHH